MTWSVLLVLVTIAGVFVYRWLTELEKEIRAGIGSSEEGSLSEEGRDDPVVPTHTVAVQILDILKNDPGVLQKDLYSRLSSIDRKVLQKELLNLDRSGKISRIRSGNSYKLILKN